MKAIHGQVSAFSLILLMIAILLILGFLATVAYQLLLLGASLQREAQQRVVAAKEWVEIRVKPMNYSWRPPPIIYLYGRWTQPSKIDYVVIKCREGVNVCGPSGFLTRELNIEIQPLEEKFLKPSQLHPALSIYDNDYFLLKNDIEYIEIHTSLGNTFLAAWGDPEYRPKITIYTTTTTTQPPTTTTTQPPTTHTTVYVTETRSYRTTVDNYITKTTTTTSTSYVGGVEVLVTVHTTIKTVTETNTLTNTITTWQTNTVTVTSLDTYTKVLTVTSTDTKYITSTTTEIATTHTSTTAWKSWWGPFPPMILRSTENATPCNVIVLRTTSSINELGRIGMDVEEEPSYLPLMLTMLMVYGGIEAVDRRRRVGKIFNTQVSAAMVLLLTIIALLSASIHSGLAEHTVTQTTTVYSPYYVTSTITKWNIVTETTTITTTGTITETRTTTITTTATEVITSTMTVTSTTTSTTTTWRTLTGNRWATVTTTTTITSTVTTTSTTTIYTERVFCWGLCFTTDISLWGQCSCSGIILDVR